MKFGEKSLFGAPKHELLSKNEYILQNICYLGPVNGMNLYRKASGGLGQRWILGHALTIH